MKVSIQHPGYQQVKIMKNPGTQWLGFARKSGRPILFPLFRKLFLALFILLIELLPAQAQHKDIRPAAERATHVTEWMKSNLQLTEDQVVKVQEINLKYAQKNDELMAGTSERKEKMKAMKDNEDAKDAELKAVFTESQYQTYLNKKSELKKEVKEKAKHHKNTP